MDRLKLAGFGERLKLGGERLKTGGAEMGRKVTGKMKELLQAQSQEAKMVDEATLDSLEEANWGLNLRICALLNNNEFDGSQVMRAIKKKITGKNTASQRLSLDLLEACAMNCDKVFSEVASEKVLDEMVRMIDNPHTHYNNRQRALQLIEAWGHSDDLDYLPTFKQTYMTLKARQEPVIPPDDSSNGSNIARQVVPPEGYHYSDIYRQDLDPNVLAYHGGVLSKEEKKEILITARNSIEILSSMLNLETEHHILKDELTMTMLEKCNESQPVLQRIIESTTDDQPILIEALSLHDELQQILSRYKELDVANSTLGKERGSLSDQVAGESTTSIGPNEEPIKDRNEAEHQTCT